MHFVLRSVDALKFAYEWNKKTSERGGKKWKGEYRQQLFEEYHATEIERIRTTTIGRFRTQQIDSIKKKFVRKHERVITARNHLLQLYQIVSGIMHLTHDSLLSWLASLVPPFSWTKLGISQPVLN